MVKSSTPPPLSSKQAKHDAVWRGWSNWLDMWSVCANAACGRARCCRGNPDACFDVNFSRLPDGVQDWFALLIEAKQRDVPFEKAWADLERIGLLDELGHWHNLTRGPQDLSDAVLIGEDAGILAEPEA
jgi:hypothetical protein